MTAEILHKVVQMLPIEEQNRLLWIMKKDLSSQTRTKKRLLTEADADVYLLKGVFGIN